MSRVATLGILLVAMLVSSRRAFAQQSLVELLGIDKLQFRALGAQMGRVDPSQVDPTNVYAITADYGEIAPHWRVVFGVSYWESHLSDRVVQTFVDSLNANITDPTGDARIARSRVSVYDVAFSAAARWMPTGNTLLRPYTDLGLAGHVINAEGKLIQGTFVENALDQIAAGFFGAVGMQVRPYGRLALEGQARADLLSGFRSAQIRAGLTYELGPPRRLTQ